MKTKKDLENELAVLREQLEKEQSRPTGATISNCNITNTDDAKVAIADAVKEGMKALQSLDGDSYGIYINGNN